MTDRADHRTALYRAFDNNGVLLYVGITRNWGARWAGHAEQSPFYDQVAHLVVEWWPSRVEALKREEVAIRTECPRHNRLHRSDGIEDSRTLRCDRCGCEYAEDPRTLWMGDVPFGPPRLVGSECLDQSGPRTLTDTFPPPCSGRLVPA